MIFNRIKVLAILIIFISITFYQRIYPIRDIPDSFLTFPVYIKIGKEFGSGFYFQSNDYIYLITAKHVLFKQNSTQLKNKIVFVVSYSSNMEATDRNILELDLEILKDKGNLKYLDLQDIVAIRILKIEQNKITTSTFQGVYLREKAKMPTSPIDSTLLKKI